MAESKTYFILRNTDYKPDCLIQLGQLIPDHRQPYRRLSPPLQPAPAAHTSPKTNWSFERSKAASGEAGIFARFVSALAAEASAHASREFSQAWRAATLEARFLELGPDGYSSYVRRSVEVDEVQEWLRRNKILWKTMYMVTGVKVAMQPGESTSGTSKAGGVAAKVSGDPGTGGVAEVGGEGKFDVFQGEAEAGTPSEDFVFAYRLRRVHVSFSGTATLGGEVRNADLYNDDYGSGQGAVPDQPKEENELGKIREVEVEEEDFGADLPAWDVKMDAVDEDDGEKCLVILPAKELPV